MFTGIVEEKGRIRSISISGNSGSISIEAGVVLEKTKIGDSIAVNGVCLTVTGLNAGGFTADIMAETYRRSSLGKCKAGDTVNLERAMAADGRFGGHIVSGHIDGTGVIESMIKEENAILITISASKKIIRLIVEKGSICIDGISLTVVRVDDNNFTVSIIPHTLKSTVLGDKKKGDIVNLENDVIAKYVERLLEFKEEVTYETDSEKKESGLTLEMLEGF